MLYIVSEYAPRGEMFGKSCSIIIYTNQLFLVSAVSELNTVGAGNKETGIFPESRILLKSNVFSVFWQSS